MKNKPKVGIIGYGVVGKAHKIAFEHHCDVFINEINPSDFASRSKAWIMHNCDFIFICVPTPYRKEQGFDRSALDSVFRELNAIYIKSRTDSPILIIKSAVVPSVVEDLINKYPQFSITVSPEYLSEKNSVADLLSQECLIVGGKDEDILKVLDLFMMHSSCNKKVKIGVCDAREAALLKYMENSFLALKVMFMNEFKALYDKMFAKDKWGEHSDIFFNDLIKIHQLDSRMGGTYPATIPGTDGNLGFGGKCLPKDILSIIEEGEKYGAPLDILKTAWEKNLKLRKDRNWETIEGAVQ